MNIRLLVIGKTSESYISEGMQLYFNRIGHYLRATIQEIPGLKNIRNFSSQQLKDKEAELVFRHLTPTSRLVILDEHGQEASSKEFAGFIEKQLNSGVKELIFLAGGAWGISDILKKRADYTLSLSKMTFPHQLVRLIFAEQLYRALTILKNEPYHNE